MKPRIRIVQAVHAYHFEVVYPGNNKFPVATIKDGMRLIRNTEELNQRIKAELVNNALFKNLPKQI